MNWLRLATESDDSIVRWLFLVNGWTLGLASGVFAVGLVFLAWNWWRAGRDRIYRRSPMLAGSSAETVRPLRYGPPIVIEYTPPEGIRPAHIGMLLRERVGDREFTATLADFAARKYVLVEEVAQGGQYGGPAWRISRLKDGDGLALWERTIFDQLFVDDGVTHLDALRPGYWWALTRAELQIREDVVLRGWFARDPETVKQTWRRIGTGTVVAGFAFSFLMGSAIRIGLVGVAISAIGLLMIATSPWMPRRTASGSEMLRRSLGFKTYVTEAEARRHEFDEQRTLFSEYLPYAIVFGSADRWAAAFHQVNTLDVLRMYVPGERNHN